MPHTDSNYCRMDIDDGAILEMDRDRQTEIDKKKAESGPDNKPPAF